jgi:hypothetical protein
VRLADADPSVRLFERDAVIACGVMTAVALAVQRGRPDAAAGVVGGFALVALSYSALKGAANLVASLASRSQPPDGDGPRPPPLPAGKRLTLAVKFFTRYALLVVGAYVMLACLRVHPVGLLAGATTPFVAAAVQAVRAFRAPSGREHP